MGFGLLGVALMQTQSLKTNHEAAQRVSANYLVDDIIARIRSVPLSMLNNYAKSATELYAIGEPSTKCTFDDQCTVQQKIINDLWEWRQNLTNNSDLVNSDSCISVLNNQVTITVAWDGLDKSKNSKDYGNSGTECISDETQSTIQDAISGLDDVNSVDDYYDKLYRRRQVTTIITI